MDLCAGGRSRSRRRQCFSPLPSCGDSVNDVTWITKWKGLRSRIHSSVRTGERATMTQSPLLLRSLKIFLLASLAVAAAPLQSAVVIAPSDETMIRTAPAIVTGTVIEVYTRHDDRGDIETVTRVLVDETIKGGVAAGEILDVVQFGGWLDGRFQAQSG